MINPKFKDNDTFFHEDDKVVARISAQRLIAGENYKVIGVGIFATAMGSAIEYHLTNESGEEFRVGNLHLLADLRGDG